MAGPVIRHDELFDFSKYFSAIEEAKASTIELAKVLNKIADSTNNNLTEAISRLKGIKVDIVSAKDKDQLDEYKKGIETLAVSVTNYRNTVKGVEKTNQIAADSILAVETEAKQLAKEIKLLSEEDRKNEVIGGQKLKRLAELKAATASYNDTVKTTTKTLQAADNSYNALSNELLQLKNQLKNLPNAFDASTGALNDQNQEAVKLSKRITEVDGAIKKMDATMGTFNRNVGNYESGTVSLRQELRNIREEMARMALEGQHGTQAYKDLAQKAGELADTMGDVSAEIKRVGSDTSTIEGIAGAFEGVAGAAAVAEGAMALFGKENDEVTESIRRLQSVQTVLMGIQSVANVLQKESAAVLLIVNAQRKLEILYTNLSTAAESKNIIVRKAATVAQWALNTAMKANPVGLLITAVALLAGVVLLFANRTQKAAEAQIKLNEVQKNYFDLLDRRSSKIEKEGQKRISAIEDELKLAKARGASDLEIMSIEQKLAETRNENAAKQKGYWSEEIKNIDAIQNSYNGYLDYVNRLKNARTQGVKTSVITNYQTNTTENKKVSEEDITAAEGIAENLKARLDRALKVRENYENAGTDLVALALEEQRKLLERSWKDKIAGDEAVLAKVKEDSLAELNAKIKLVNDKRDYELKNVNLTAGEIKNINAKADKDISDLKKSYNEKVQKSEINSRISVINAGLALAKEGSDEEYALKFKLVEENGKLEILAAQNSINSETEKAKKIEEINAKVLADKKKLEKEKRLAELDNSYNNASYLTQLEIAKNKEILASHKSTLKQIRDARNANDILTQQSLQKELDLNQKKYDEGLILFEDYEKSKTDIKLKQSDERIRKAEEEAQRETELQQLTFQTITEGINAVTQLYNFSIDNRIAKIEQEKEASISAAGDNAAAKERIEKTFNRKIASEKRRQAQAEKIGALFSIAINTAAGIMETIKKMGLPAAIPFIIATGVIGAAQAAVVAAKPIPKYKKGTNSADEGLAIVNDEPGSIYQELIVRDRKAYLPSKRNQLVNLKRGDKVIPAMRTAQILSSAERNMEMQRLLAGQTLNNTLSEKLDIGRKLEVEHTMANAFSLNIARMGEEIGKHTGSQVGKQLANLPLEQNIWDDAGYQKRIRKGNTTINYLNKRNSL